MRKTKIRFLYIILAASLMISAAMVAVGVSNSRIVEAAAAATQTPAQQTSQASPMADPTANPTVSPTPNSTENATVNPTPDPTKEPKENPTPNMTASVQPSAKPTAEVFKSVKVEEVSTVSAGTEKDSTSLANANSAGKISAEPVAAVGVPGTNNRVTDPIAKAPVIATDDPGQEATGTYAIENGRFGIDNTGANARATTDGINAALKWAKEQGYKSVKFDKGTYMVQCNWRNRYIAPTDGILVPSGLTLDLNGSTFKMEPNSYPEYTVFGIVNASNVTIKNGTLIGDLDSHVYAPSSDSPSHEFGFGIVISASTNVTVRNLKISKMTGDGIIVEGSYTALADGGKVSSKVRLLDNKISNCRRQGISVIGMRDSEIAGNTIYGIKGTDPQYGIDIEKELDYVVDKLKIHDNVIYDCSGGAISCHSGTDYEVYNNVVSGNILTVYSTNIKVYNNTIKNSFIQVMRSSSNITVEGNIMDGDSWVRID